MRFWYQKLSHTYSFTCEIACAKFVKLRNRQIRDLWFMMGACMFRQMFRHYDNECTHSNILILPMAEQLKSLFNSHCIYPSFLHPYLLELDVPQDHGSFYVAAANLWQEKDQSLPRQHITLVQHVPAIGNIRTRNIWHYIAHLYILYTFTDE